ncbi:hypothetical protein [Pseudovibrio brasiliensis]|uniref:Uncharacterized protein n=1 Tax=Pseudovibrio brasiliensis TaxID=1898042 RepID=A0ABX8AL56_9HYPH|nr:hypothetical protein [Pseudovibrio brasiliensis]QUS55789.1 hypothetical protein KGB56_21290 [Pseudovibrio brasiliensis]
MFLLDILFDILGYYTARFVLPIISLGHIRAEELSVQNTSYNIFGFRKAENCKLYFSFTMAGWIGVFIWIFAAGLVLWFIRNSIS